MADADLNLRAAKPGGRDLTQGPITRTLLAFALPTLGSSVLQSLNGSVNAIWVGRLVGEDALAATANANMTMFLLTSFVFGFGMASTILIGQAFGRRDIDGARRVLGTAIGGFSLIAVIIAVLGWFFAPQILGLLGTPGGAMPLALAYMRVIFIAMPAQLMLVLAMMALRGSGDSLTPLWFMALSVLLDSGLNPLFISGIGPFPALGIAGAATATVIASYAALIGMIVYVYARDLPLRLRGRELSYLKPDATTLRTIMGKGLPMGLQMIVISISSLALIGLVNQQGVHTTAAFGVAMQLWTYVQMPAMALGAAVSAMAAQNIGAGAWERLGAITRSGVISVLVITGLLVAALALADRPALALFLGEGSEALPIAQHIQLLATWSFMLFGVTLVLFGTMRANGAVIGPLLILCVGLIPVRLGFAYFGQRWFGPDALWLSFPASTVVNLVLAVIYYRSGGWRKAAMAEPRSELQLREDAVQTGEAGGRITPSA